MQWSVLKSPKSGQITNDRVKIRSCFDPKTKVHWRDINPAREFLLCPQDKFFGHQFPGVEARSLIENGTQTLKLSLRLF